jgi:hypothetical protein
VSRDRECAARRGARFNPEEKPMNRKNQICVLLAACGGIAGTALAQPYVVSGSGATLQESFFRAVASTNDFIDADGDGTAGSLGSFFPDQLAPEGSGLSTPPFTNAFFLFHYRLRGSGNGIAELDARGTTFATSNTDLAIADSSIWQRQNLILSGVLQGIGSTTNPGGVPFKAFTSGPNAYKADASNAATSGIQIDLATSDVPIAWFQTITGTSGPIRVPGAAGYGNNARVSTDKTGAPVSTGHKLRNLSNLNTNVASPDANTVYDFPIAIVPVAAYVNYGVGMSEIEMSDLRSLFATGRRLGGENLMAITRDSGSGTRNAFANGIGLDPSYCVGENVGLRADNSAEDRLGPIFIPSNKNGSSRVDGATRNHRLAVGQSGAERYLSSSSLNNGQVDMLAVRADIKGGTVFARPTIDAILDGGVNGYNIIGPATYATVGNPFSAPASLGGSGWDINDGPSSGPAPRNPGVSAYMNNILRSIAAFVSVPGGSDTEFMPGEWLAQNFLLTAAPDRVPQTNPNPAAQFIPPVVNATQNINVRNFAANDPLQLFADPAFASFNTSSAGRVPARTTLSSGTYSDGSTSAYIDQAGNTYAASGAVTLPARNKIAGDFDGDGVRSLADATGLVAAWRQRNGGPAWVAPDGIYGAGAGSTAIIEVLGDFDGDGNFNAADVRYWADGLALVDNGFDILPSTPDGVSDKTLDRAAGFTAVDNAFGGNFFGTTLATGTYNAGDSRGDVFGPGAATTRGFAPIGHDGVVDAFDIDYVCANFGDFTVLADAVNMDLSCDMNGDLLVDRADIEAIVEGILDSAFGDVNLDGILDGADQAIITANLNTAGGWAQGDLNCDGQITQADFCAVADLNGDGLADFGDVGIFVNAFTTGGSEADLNADGLNDFGDVGIFVSWFSACN